MNLTQLKNEVLVVRLKDMVAQERKLLSEILSYLFEVERRRLFLEMGYPSLLEFCVRHLKYSEGAAQRRISAMRLIKSVPPEAKAEINNKLAAGNLNLSHLSKAQHFFNQEKKETQRIFSAPEKLEVLNKLENLTYRQTEKQLSSLTSKPEAQKIKLQFEADQNLIEQIDRIREIMSHKNPSASLEEVIAEISQFYLGRKDPLIKQEQRSVPPAPAVNGKAKHNPGTARSRYIPANVKQKVWNRDQGECAYVDPKSGAKCGSRHFIQIDHIKRFSDGGVSTNPNNLRLLCGAHNRYRETRL